MRIVLTVIHTITERRGRTELKCIWSMLETLLPHAVASLISHELILTSAVFSSEVALHNHTTLKSLTTLQLLPSIDGADLDADEVLVRILGPEIGHRLGLLHPRVPDHGVVEVVADDVEERLAILQDGGGVLLDRLIDAIGLAGDFEGGVVLRVLGSVEDFVGVGGRTKAVDLELGDVLRGCQYLLMNALKDS